MSRALGIALDIDGVLLRGKHVIPNAVSAIKLLIEHKIPYIYLTNGGGVSEEGKANELSHKFDMEVNPRQILLSHTPLKSLLPKYANKPILILGHDGCFEVAKEYGFRHACNVHAVHADNGDRWPRRVPNMKYGTVDATEIEAIVNFHDPLDWALELQICSDLLIENSNVKYYSCNSDLTYSGAYHRPRFTQGSFNECLKHLLDKNFQTPLEITNFGKPYGVQYRYAENMLAWEAHLLKRPSPTRYFGIGDNPKADIRGANNAGGGWKSVLVRTGVFQSSEPNDKEDPAHLVAVDVLDAIQAIIKLAGKD